MRRRFRSIVYCITPPFSVSQHHCYHSARSCRIDLSLCRCTLVGRIRLLVALVVAPERLGRLWRSLRLRCLRQEIGRL
ncbi:MAG: hypothetical protein AAGD25_06415 [Cyanobacteria bacterium P01_F01_bin.150]